MCDVRAHHRTCNFWWVWCVKWIYCLFKHSSNPKRAWAINRIEEFIFFFFSKVFDLFGSIEKYFSLNWQQTWKQRQSERQTCIWIECVSTRYLAMPSNVYIVEYVYKMHCSFAASVVVILAAHSTFSPVLSSIIYSNFPYSIVGRRVIVFACTSATAAITN